MAQPVPEPDHRSGEQTGADPFHDADGYLRSAEDAAAYAIIASGGQGFTTPACEARRMLAGPDPRYQALGRDWLRQHGLPEIGDSEPAGWQNWYSDWLNQHPAGVAAALQLATAMNATVPPDSPSRPELHLVPPAPPVKVQPEIPPGSRLESLLSQQSDARAQLDAAEERMATIKNGVTEELTALYPGTAKFDIPAGPGWEDLQLYYSAPNYFSTKRFKEERPDLYEQYLKPSPRWTFGKPSKKGSQ